MSEKSPKRNEEVARDFRCLLIKKIVEGFKKLFCMYIFNSTTYFHFSESIEI